MKPLKAIFLAPAVNDWLVNSRHSRILHVFDHACNLINEFREVLSIVTQQIGNGPFNLVIEGDVLFSDHLSLQSQISISPNQLHLGDLTINTGAAKLWSSHPDWKSLYARRDDITKLLLTNYKARGLDTPSPALHQTQCGASVAKPAQDYSTTATILQSSISNSLISSFSTALVTADISSAITITSQLAGLGQGLTPTGDDIILGAILATWIIHPPEVASVLAEEITRIAAPLTTSLSAAWLKSAGRGEAGILWHEFFDALIFADPGRVQEVINRILAVGETSGTDALAGFFGVFMYWAECFKKTVSEDNPMNERIAFSMDYQPHVK